MIAIWGPGATEYRFYWHQELESFSTLEHASAFVGDHQSTPYVASDLTDLLGSSGNAKQLASSAAESLANGQMLTGGGAGARLDPAWQYWADFHDQRSGLQFLGRFRHDSIALARLRTLLQRHKLAADVSTYSAEEVLVEVATLLSAGRLVAGERLRARSGGYSEDTTAAPAKAPSAAATPPPSTSEPEDESPTLPDNDGAAQAAALKAAAQEAFPFCEECQKAFVASHSN